MTTTAWRPTLRQHGPVTAGARIDHVTTGLLVVVDGIAVLAAIARFGHVTPNTILLVGLALWLIAVGGYHRPRFHLSTLDDMASIGGRVVVAISLGAAYRELVSGHDVFTADRLWVLAGAAAFVLAGRSMAYGLLRRLRRFGPLRRQAAFVGSPATEAELSEAILATPEAGLDLVPDTVDDAPPPVDVVIAEVSDGGDWLTPDELGRLDRSGVDVYLLPSALLRYPATIPGADQLWSIPLLPLRSAAVGSFRWKMKRVLDVLVASFLLVVTAPVVLVAAAVLRLQHGPGVLFRQERVGHGGRRFTMLKLRTMAPDPTVDEEIWQVPAARLSPFGRFCRATSIDELPQLWNVLKGDMSLVGPRPERPQYVAQFSASIPHYDDRHRVPVGLTGLAQVNGLRGDTSIRDRARFDNRYIDNWSLIQDLKIMARTATSILTRRGRGS